MEVLLGTSGWSYDEWVPIFYPDSSIDKLSYYSKIFKIVEVDSTFYSYPKESLVKKWSFKSPRDFKFCLKLPKLLTHEKKLDPKEELKIPLERFLDLIKPLKQREKLGLILIQLPPSFTFSKFDWLEGFFKILPDTDFAVEFRDRSWLRDESWKLLRKYNITYTIVDEPLLPPLLEVTSKKALIRWHGHGKKPWYDYYYTDDELKNWVPKINDLILKAKELYGFFNNHFRGYAVANCLKMLKLLNLTDEYKEKVLSDIEQKIKKESARLGLFDLSLYSIDELLEFLAPRFKLERAKEIKESEIKFFAKDNVFEGIVRDYEFKIDINKRDINHNCPDWLKREGGELCKHMVKVFQLLPEDVSRRLILDIIQHKKYWSFR
ncbi:MAG: DUF72 domain-containing protein [Nitrososphaerales archaeon]